MIRGARQIDFEALAQAGPHGCICQERVAGKLEEIGSWIAQIGSTP